MRTRETLIALLMALWPIIFMAGVVWLDAREQRRRKEWEADPSQPWNVRARMEREAFEWQRDEHRKRHRARLPRTLARRYNPDLDDGNWFEDPDMGAR